MSDLTYATVAARSALEEYRHTPGDDPKGWALAAVPMAYALQELLNILEIRA